MTGPWAGYDPQDLPGGCDVFADSQGLIPPDLDADGDVDLSDFGLFQRCMTGPDVEPDPTCTEDL